MSIELWASILAGAIVLATPLVIAGLGEGFVERAGRLNLGIEGMMILGAFVAVFVASFAGRPPHGGPQRAAVHEAEELRVRLLRA